MHMTISIFHRSVRNFVIQGGGFKAPTERADYPDQTLTDPIGIVPIGTVRNEPGNSNTRGTIAMAKPNNNPEGATSQFFFNISDNTYLDNENGGYTQFGKVLGSGMTVVDTMNQPLNFRADAYYANTALGSFLCITGALMRMVMGLETAPETLLSTRRTS